MVLAIVWMVLGTIGLVVGGDLLVRGASRIAAAVGISPLVIGLTVVAFGTSAPELAVAVKAAFAGETDIAVGNVVGSNIFNVLFILGLAAAITPLVVNSQLIRIEVPLMIAVSVVMYLLSLDGTIGRVDGLILFSSLIVYTVWTVLRSRRETAAIQEEYETEYPPRKTTALEIAIELGFIVGGLVLLTAGADRLVVGASELARQLGMSELLIGLTIVAIGTSLPEVATSIMASIRGERDIAVGNVVGSNLFNLMSVLGLAAIVAPGGIIVSDEAIQRDIPVMIAVAVACLPIFFTGHLIARWEGILFFAYYVAYMVYLIMAALNLPASQLFGWAMVVFVLPLTAVTLIVGVIRAWLRPSRPQDPTESEENASV